MSNRMKYMNPIKVHLNYVLIGLFNIMINF